MPLFSRGRRWLVASTKPVATRLQAWTEQKQNREFGKSCQVFMALGL